MKTSSLTGSCDCCIIYRPETNFANISKTKLAPPIFFSRRYTLGNFKLIGGVGVWLEEVVVARIFAGLRKESEGSEF